MVFNSYPCLPKFLAWIPWIEQVYVVAGSLTIYYQESGLATRLRMSAHERDDSFWTHKYTRASIEFPTHVLISTQVPESI
jgi:hypothetical protein